MSTNASHRQRLFKLYSRNLSLHHPSLVDRFLCPVCLRQFDKAALEASPPEVDLAHILPKAIGGRVCTMTCRECNSSFGTRYESHLATDEQDYQWGRGRATKKAHLKFESHEMAVDWKTGPNGDHHFEVKAGTYHPDAEHELKERLCREGTLNLTFNLANPRSRSAALTHTAFLKMFHRFGYEYALQANLKVVRDALQQGPGEFEFRRIVGDVPSLRTDQDLSEPSIAVLVEPAEFACFVVFVPVDRDRLRGRIVLLPGFGRDAAESFSRLIRSNVDFRKCRCQIFKITVSPVVALADPRRRALGREFWKRGLAVGRAAK